MLRNVDELFGRDELSAAPDQGWPDCFNSGVFVLEPSHATFQRLVQYAIDHGSFDGMIHQLDYHFNTLILNFIRDICVRGV